MSFTVDVKETAAFVYIDTKNSKVNLVDDATLDQVPSIVQKLKCVAVNSEINYVAVISTKPNCFMTGLDPYMLSKRFIASLDGHIISKRLQKLIKCLMDFPKPVIAVINGECSSFGLELALACMYRVTLNGCTCTFSMPDIQWGLCSTAGGCLLLPRVTSLNVALDMILNGSYLNDEEAISVGLVDYRLPFNRACGNYMKTLDYLADYVEILEKTKKGSWIKNPVENGFFEKFINFVSFKWDLKQRLEADMLDNIPRLYPAPFSALEMILYGLKADLNANDHIKAYFLVERLAFGELSVANQTQSLLRLQSYKSEQLNASGRDIRYTDYASDATPPCLKFTSCNVEKNKYCFYPIRRLQNNCRMVHKESRIDNESENLVNLVDISTYEKPCNSKCIVAVVSARSNPFDYQIYNDKTIGIRVFNCVHKVVEIVPSKSVSNEVLATIKDLCISQGNIVYIAANTPGSFLLRVLMSMMVEMMCLIAEGVDPWKLQRWLQKFGFIGATVALLDEIGVDVVHQELCYLSQIYGQRFNNPDSLQLLEEMIANGYLGKKVKRNIIDDFCTNRYLKTILNKYREKAKDHNVNKSDAVNRVIYRLINETLMCLQEGVIESCLDGDAAAIYALGFPPARGGPIRWVDTRGAVNVVKNMNESNIVPCKLLTEFAENGKKFYS
ncbi:hypothetical protein CHUAL_004930 [Chamberlinius hualienensis]